MHALKSIFASAYAATLTICAVTAMTIGAELSLSFKTWLAGFTGHHWITKSWISVLVFAVFFFLFRITGASIDGSNTKKALIVLKITAVLGFLVILGFYVYEFFPH